MSVSSSLGDSFALSLTVSDASHLARRPFHITGDGCFPSTVRLLKTAKPKVCCSAPESTTRRTWPSIRTRTACAVSGSPSMRTLSPTLAPRGGQTLPTINTPNSLMSRLRPSPCCLIPLASFHQKATGASRGKRIARRAAVMNFGISPRNTTDIMGHYWEAADARQENECCINCG